MRARQQKDENVRLVQHRRAPQRLLTRRTVIIPRRGCILHTNLQQPLLRHLQQQRQHPEQHELQLQVLEDVQQRASLILVQRARDGEIDPRQDDGQQRERGEESPQLVPFRLTPSVSSVSTRHDDASRISRAREFRRHERHERPRGALLRR